MAKYFLGSVGKAEAFRWNNGKLEKMFVSKTLTNSSLNISTTKDDIRAGEGAPIQFSFYHDASVEITLTDVLWEKNYLTAQLGAEWQSGADGISYRSDKITFTSGTGVGNYAIKPMPVNCKEGGKIYAAWATPVGTDNWQMVDEAQISVASSTGIPTFTITGATGDYCVRYLTEDSRAAVAEITSTIVPAELFLIITAPIFAGDACASSKGTAAGSIQFEVPRFSLNGSQEFSMEMSSNQTMSLSGVALAAESTDNCDVNGGKLLRVIEVINERKWYEDADNLFADPDLLKVGDVPAFYVINKDGSVQKAVLEDLYKGTTKFTRGYAWESSDAGSVTVALKKEDGTVIDSISVTVTEQ